MSLKVLYHSVSERVRNYNLFKPEIDIPDDDDAEPADPATVLKRQKYATWLYILLLIGK